MGDDKHELLAMENMACLSETHGITTLSECDEAAVALT
jgi:hypothetical protein